MMRVIRRVIFFAIFLLCMLYIARNEIISFYFSEIYPLGKSSKIRLTDPYISLFPPSIQFKELEIKDIKDNTTLFFLERFKLEAKWPLIQSKSLEISKISGRIRYWRIIREPNGRTNLDWIAAWSKNYKEHITIHELNLSARDVIFIDYVFSEDGLQTKQASNSIESIVLYSIKGNLSDLAAWIFPKIWFDVPFSVRNISSARRPVSHLRLQNHDSRIYPDTGITN